LRDRALRMLEVAKKSLTDGSYDIAAFMSEQASQLYIKSVVLELTGETLRSHSLRQLLRSLRDLVPQGERIEEFIRQHRGLLVRLEDAYIVSRYVVREYEEDEAEELVKFAEELIGFVRGLQKQA